jgi:hypothetical protein
LLEPRADASTKDRAERRAKKGAAMKFSYWVLGPLMMACASTPPPTHRIASANDSVASARQAGANDSALASLYLQSAQEQIGFAKGLVKKGDMERADLVLVRANADADLARSLAREQQARSKAGQAVSMLQAVQRQQMQQNGQPTQ